MRAVPLAVILVACGDNHPAGDAGAIAPPLPAASECNSWRQWGHSAAHGGASCASGQPLRAVLSERVYDPFLDQELADARGDLRIHYQSPLIDGDDVYMLIKRGSYTPCHTGSSGPSCNDPDERYRLHSQIWAEQQFVVGRDGALVPGWSFDSDWKPEPQIGFEPVFQPAVTGSLIAIPGAGGALWQLDRATGGVVRHVQPLGRAIDPDTYVAGGLTVGPDGTIYYHAVKLDHDQPLDRPSQAWLVAVSPDGTPRVAEFASLVPGAPAATDLCLGTYDLATTPLPWPPAGLAAPPSAPCGPQRPGINAAPAVAADGTIFTVSRAHGNERYAYVVAIDPSLSPRWATSLRDLLHDDCGVATPSDGTATDRPFDCRAGTPLGVERVTGLAPAARVNDGATSSPVALPDGGVLYGAFTGYNATRGHLIKLDRRGGFAGAYDFGWDTTPAVVGGPLDYRIVIKDNHYGSDASGADRGPFYLTALDAALHVVWQFASTSTQSCARQPDGSTACTDDHPHGFEWCVNAVAVDRDGTVFANSEDGRTYAITAAGALRDSVFLDRALGAAYTPIALDRAGRVFALNAGRLWVLGEEPQRPSEQW
ncbi:MAG TPA: hypothetical protein VK607_09010 [Kofleriaceae bacterium]|nr:hypothetical protein [Kofleriaceae bacterium]